MGRSRSRDRDRKKKKKYRTRSEESAERSREREKRRRRQQREFMQKYGGKGGGKGRNKESGEKENGGGMFWDGFQWIPVGDKQQQEAKQDAAARKLKRLYVGNLPISLGLTEERFGLELVKAMKDEGICDKAKSDEEVLEPIAVWFRKDANYGFLECTTAEEAEKVLVKLNGMLIMGQPIDIKRPADSEVIRNAGQKKGPLALTAPVQATTRILEIGDALAYDRNNHDEELFAETFEDMMDGCGAHGKIHGGKIIHPKHSEQLGALAEQVKIGHVYLEFASIADAGAVMQKMGVRTYDGRYLKYKSFPEEQYFALIEKLPQLPPA